MYWKGFCFSCLNIFVQVGKNKSLSADELDAIAKRTSEGAFPSDIAKEQNRDARTVKKHWKHQFQANKGTTLVNTKIHQKIWEKLLELLKQCRCIAVKPSLMQLVLVESAVLGAVGCCKTWQRFLDECGATLDGPDGWSTCWIDLEGVSPSRLIRQQDGGGVMF